MLQVLCQILQTENLNDIQSWLAASGPTGSFAFLSMENILLFNWILEKEAVRQLITKAIKGLEENGRMALNDSANSNAKGIQVNMDSFGSLLANR